MLMFVTNIAGRTTVPGNGEVVKLDYEPDPSKSTCCKVIPEDYARVEARCIDTKTKKDRDYRGYELSVSYLQLDKDFDWL